MTVRPRRTPRRPAALGVVAAMVVALGACGDSSGIREEETADPDEQVQEPDVEAGSLDDFYTQQLQWSSCGSHECAVAATPVDYADPIGETVSIALEKRVADGDDPLGTIFVNPGGPGGSGVEFVEQVEQTFRPQVLERYDIVGFDPRGVGLSDPVDCYDTEELDAFIAVDPSPDDDQEAAQALQETEEFGAACQEQTGDLLAHVSTIEVARDLDVLRAVVGDDTLTYYGASYGTTLGSTYAELFPDKVGRMVLDGATDPSLSAEESNKSQAAGFQRALEAYLDDCLAGADCPFEGDRETALQRIETFLAELDEQPLPTNDPDRPLTQSLGFFGIAVTLYDEESWEYLSQGLQQAFDGDGSTMLLLADFYFSRENGEYTDNSAEAIYAVNCLDEPLSLSVEEIEASVPEYEEASRTFGDVFAWSLLSCSNWPVTSSEEPITIDAAGAAPIVVIGTTRDPATPYEEAVALAEQLESGVLITREGDGHTAFRAGNECVDSAVDALYLEGAVPEDGLEC
jgi:pimeloyl-ACP methyl ester carboxylesterase